MALIPPAYLNSVVAIGVTKNNEYHALATGFLVGFLNGNKNEKGDGLYTVCLVTNRHVFVGKQQATLRFNMTQGGSKTYVLDLKDDKGNLWMVHSNNQVDVAVVPIDFNSLKHEGIDCIFIPEGNIAYQARIKEEGIVQGDFIFVLGFPLGISGHQQNYTVVRGGVIARLDEEIIKREGHFLIDSSVFPGNSGGPVFSKPEVISIQGTSAVNRSYLIGVVSGFLPYKDTCVSRQTGEERIVFVENSGLGTVVPMDYVKEVVDSFLNFQRKKASELQTAKQEETTKKENAPA